MHGYFLHEWSVASVPKIPNIIKNRAADVWSLNNTNSTTSGDLISPEDLSKRRIAIIGDSVAYGTGVRTGQRFGQALEKKLGSDSNRVYNLAQSGDSIFDHYAKFQLAEQRLKPDIYIITLVDNDLVIDERKKYLNSPNLYEQLLETCDSEPFVYDWNNITIEWDEFVNTAMANSVAQPSGSVCFTTTIINDIMSQGKTVYFFPITLFTTENKCSSSMTVTEELQSYAMATIIDLVKKSGGTVLDPLAYGYSYQPISAHEQHPSAETHEAIATILTKVIQHEEIYIR